MSKISCSECGRVYRVSDQYAGKRIRCKDCSQINTIPQPENETVGNGDSVANLNNLLRELAKAEKAAPDVEIEP
jgi:phage FluMu protein Com